jgi:hypothetical protein
MEARRLLLRKKDDLKIQALMIHHLKGGMTSMKKLLIVVLLAFVLITIAGCTAGPNELSNSPNEEGKVAGFWQGLWQGIIAPVTFIISLFSDKVHMYEVHNNGGWYNFGFLFGMIIIFGGGGRGSARRR